MSTSAPTLYEDWRNRREKLGEGDVPAQEWERALQIRILNYLLKRYAADPVAQLPARFPVSTELFLNRRAILVHRHLSLAPKTEVRNSADATRKVSRILQRIKAQSPQESACIPADGEFLGDQIRHSMKRIFPPLLESVPGEKAQYADPNDFHRVMLLSENPRVRINAAYKLADDGTLDDVNLFLELIALPPDEEMAQKLLPVIERPSEVSPPPVGSGIGAPHVLPEDPPEPPKKPTLTPEELEFYRDELMDNFADVTSVVNLLNDTGPPQMPLPCTDEDAGVPLPPRPVKSEPEMLDERKVLEECAMRLARKEHRTA
jgi:hypothetical protein